MFITKLTPDGSGVEYSTLLGGEGYDEGYGVAVDAAGNAYVSGATGSPDFPTSANAFQRALSGGVYDDAFVVKLKPNGSLAYSTYIGGNGHDGWTKIAVDASGNAYISGYTRSTNFPLANAAQSNHDGTEYSLPNDIFVSKLNAEGSALLYSTYFGGNNSESAEAIALDKLGNVYVTGRSSSSDLRVSSVIYPAIYGNNVGFVVKLNPTLSGSDSFVYCATFGNKGRGIAVDASGNAYVSTEGSPNELIKLNPGGSAPIYRKTSPNVFIRDVAVDEAGNAYLCGVRNGNAYVGKLKPEGDVFEYEMELGGSASDGATGIAVSPGGAVYVSGITSSSDFPVTAGAFQTTYPVNPNNGRTHFTTFIAKIGGEPLIFVPGIAGSHLVDRGAGILQSSDLWPGFYSNHSRLTLDPRNQQTDVVATDAIRTYSLFNGLKEVESYTPLLEMLTDEDGGDFTEYNVEGIPERRLGRLRTDTEEGCDYERQKDNNPNLFVFAYDWRLSADDNARSLGEYVKCVQKFHPDTKVNILAHSMGGLVARRYILQHGGTNDHHVNRLITINTPWLGAPKAIHVMETGNFMTELVWAITLRPLVEFFPGVHQLLPSRYYHDVSRYYTYMPASPFVEEGRDINNNGSAYENYTYEQQVQLLDVLHPHERSRPGTTGKNFHEVSGQDDWQSDTSGVEYHQILSTQNHNNTIGQVSAVTPETECFGGASDSAGLFLRCNTGSEFKVTMTLGDGTVPFVSAERGTSKGLRFSGFNAATNKMYYFFAPSDVDAAVDNDYEHLNLTKKREAHDLILTLLGLKSPPVGGYPSFLPENYYPSISRMESRGKNRSLDTTLYNKGIPATRTALSFKQHETAFNKLDARSTMSEQEVRYVANNQVHPRGITMRSSAGGHHQPDLLSASGGVVFERINRIGTEERLGAFSFGDIHSLGSRGGSRAWISNRGHHEFRAPLKKGNALPANIMPVPTNTAFARDANNMTARTYFPASARTNGGAVVARDTSEPSGTQETGAYLVGPPPSPTQPSYYVTVKGVAFVSITDANGNTNTPIDGTFALRVPNVSYDLLGEKAVLISIPTNQTYIMTFQVGTSPVMVESIKGINNIKPTQIIRYRDKTLPVGVTAMLKITAAGVEDLRYDADGDGTFETVVAPTVRVEGSAASDVTPPVVSINATVQQAQTIITLTVSDAASGVKAVYYSLDGTEFRPYTAPFQVDPATVQVVYAFADDNLANRSSLITYRVPIGITGHVADAQGTAISGVDVTLNWTENGTTRTRTSVTNINGDYVFADLARGATYTVRATKTGTTFNPVSYTANELNGNYVANFIGSTQPAGTPYSGSPVTLPGIVSTENFDDGGEGVAYHDTDAGNNGGQYRATDVDILGDGLGGYKIGWVQAGEWLDYSVNVTTTGTYDLAVPVGSPGAGGTFHIEIDGADITGAMSVPDIGWWLTHRVLTKPNVQLLAGVHTLRLVMDTNGAHGYTGDVDYLSFTRAGQQSEDAPFVIGMQPGTPRNWHTGMVGMKIITGAQPLTVGALGRLYINGNTGVHSVSLVRASDNVTVARVEVATAGGASGEFKYVALSVPVTLPADTAYYLATSEVAGGDYWYDPDARVTTATFATAGGATYSNASGNYWTVLPGNEYSYGLANFRTLPTP